MTFANIIQFVLLKVMYSTNSSYTIVQGVGYSPSHIILLVPCREAPLYMGHEFKMTIPCISPIVNRVCNLLP